MYMASRIDARLGRMETRMDDLTFFVQQFTSLVVPPRQRRNYVTQANASLKVDGFSKVIGFGSNTKALIVAHETMSILYTLSDATTKIFTSTIDILDYVGQVDGEIFIRATDTGVDIIISDDHLIVQDGGEVVTPILEIHDQATTPMLKDIHQVATLVSKETNKVVDPVIGA